jgi:hypothetical protein
MGLGGALGIDSTFYIVSFIKMSTLPLKKIGLKNRRGVYF